MSHAVIAVVMLVCEGHIWCAWVSLGCSMVQAKQSTQATCCISFDAGEPTFSQADG